MKNFFSKNKDSGYIILFSVLVSSIILSVIFGLTNTAYRQRVFSKEAKDSSRALFSADAGIECATAWDNRNTFESLPNSPSIECLRDLGSFTMADTTNGDGSVTYTSPLTEPFPGNTSCMQIIVTKNIPAGTDAGGSPIYATRVDSKGYNKDCGTVATVLSTNTDSNLVVERFLSYTYTRGN